MTVHNGPGIRTLVMLKGCPLRCIWCSTPESQSYRPEILVFPDRCIHCNKCLTACPVDAVHLSESDLKIDRNICNACGKCAAICYPGALSLAGRLMTVAEIIKEVIKDRILYKHSSGGVTLSGGEPLSEIDFTLELLRALSADYIDTGVDTCGYVPPEDLLATFPYVSFFLWDIKIMDNQKHKEFTGVSNELILENLQLVSQADIPIYIRIPLIPGYNDFEDNIRATCEYVRNLKSLVEIDLLPLHHLGETRYAGLDRLYPLKDVPLMKDEHIKSLKKLVESYNLSCKIVG